MKRDSEQSRQRERGHMQTDEFSGRQIEREKEGDRQTDLLKQREKQNGGRKKEMTRALMASTNKAGILRENEGTKFPSLSSGS